MAFMRQYTERERALILADRNIPKLVAQNYRHMTGCDACLKAALKH